MRILVLAIALFVAASAEATPRRIAAVPAGQIGARATAVRTSLQSYFMALSQAPDARGAFLSQALEQAQGLDLSSPEVRKIAGGTVAGMARGLLLNGVSVKGENLAQFAEAMTVIDAHFGELIADQALRERVTQTAQLARQHLGPEEAARIDQRMRGILASLGGLKDIGDSSAVDGSGSLAAGTGLPAEARLSPATERTGAQGRPPAVNADATERISRGRRIAESLSSAKRAASRGASSAAEGVAMALIVAVGAAFAATRFVFGAGKMFIPRMTGALALPILASIGWFGHGPLGGLSHSAQLLLGLIGLPIGYVIGALTGLLVVGLVGLGAVTSKNLGRELLILRVAGALLAPILAGLGLAGIGPLASLSLWLLAAISVIGAPIGYSAAIAGAFAFAFLRRLARG